VQELYSDRLAAGLAADLASTTVNHLHDTLHKALKRAMRLGLVARNVTELVDAPRVRPAEMRPLSREETHRLIETAAGDRLEAPYVLAVATGMRQSELLGLRWYPSRSTSTRTSSLTCSKMRQQLWQQFCTGLSPR
jgi:integrase